MGINIANGRERTVGISIPPDLIERYREIMAWDIPENDPLEADRLIFSAVHATLDEVEQKNKIT